MMMLKNRLPPSTFPSYLDIYFSLCSCTVHRSNRFLVMQDTSAVLLHWFTYSLAPSTTSRPILADRRQAVSTPAPLLSVGQRLLLWISPPTVPAFESIVSLCRLSSNNILLWFAVPYASQVQSVKGQYRPCNVARGGGRQAFKGWCHSCSSPIVPGIFRHDFVTL
jgi:hypothetical protein